MQHDQNKIIVLIKHVFREFSENIKSYAEVDRIFQKIYVEDNRLETALMLAEYMPLPPDGQYAANGLDEPTEEDRARMDLYKQFANELPGIYRDVPSDTSGTKKTVFESLDGPLDVAELEREIMNGIFARHRMWAALFFHHDEKVRRIVALRIPEEGNDLSPILNILATDPIGLVRDVAAKKIKMDYRKSRRAWKQGTLPVKDSILRVLNADPGTQLGDHTLGWGAVHPSVKVRRAAASRIDPESPLWATLVHDSSTRVIHEAAMRISLDHELLETLKAHGDEMTARIIAKRRLQRLDLEE